MVSRLEWLRQREWSLAILDEAQAIKNPGARQTKAVKQLRAPARVALTGTPVENSLGDLWSLFDFLNPGLLGGASGSAAGSGIGRTRLVPEHLSHPCAGWCAHIFCAASSRTDPLSQTFRTKRKCTLSAL